MTTTIQDLVAKAVSYEGWISMFDDTDAAVIDKYIALAQNIAPTIDSLLPKLTALYKTLKPFIDKAQKENNAELSKAFDDALADIPELKAVLPEIQGMLPSFLKILKVLESL